MRLLHARTFTLEEFFNTAIPPYAILSHTWESQEVSFRDIQDLALAKSKRGFIKIEYSCAQARRDRLEYVWVDTCCINKESSSELQEAINSMFNWYRDAVVCYVYLSDVLGSCPQIDVHGLSLESFANIDTFFTDFREKRNFWLRILAKCSWFSRGWTLQELIAPKSLSIYGQSWNFIGSKSSLLGLISFITNIDVSILNNKVDVLSVSVAKRMSWAANRRTSRIEDQAYSLLGIFGVNMPMLYGEGSKAFKRLQEEIVKTSNDHSIFAWNGPPGNGSLFAESPASFVGASKVTRWGLPASFEVTNRGIRISLMTIRKHDYGRDELVGILNCRYEDDIIHSIGIRLQKYPRSDDYYVVTSDETSLPQSSRLTKIDMMQVKTAQLYSLDITRIFERRSSSITLLLRQVRSHLSPGAFIKTFYPENQWYSSGISPFNRYENPERFRVAIQIRCPSGGDFRLSFGCDLIVASRQSIIGLEYNAGLRLEYYGPRVPLRDIDLFAMNWHPCPHGTCAHIDKDICCPMLTCVSAKGDVDSEFLMAELCAEEIMGEKLYIVNIRMGPIYELEAEATEKRVFQANPVIADGYFTGLVRELLYDKDGTALET